jgi:hypothetical protein
MSIRCANPQSRHHAENKGPERAFFYCQSHQLTEIKGTYQNPWELENSMTKCPAQ